jgi:NADH-ubiquinone oxidoreductase chain 2
MGFFGKQMILSSALDKGYIFISYVAILTSVISAVYYLNIIKQMFFDISDFKMINVNSDNFNSNTKIVINSSLTTIISIITLVIILFFLIPQE